jgi:hypothetical protein
VFTGEGNQALQEFLASCNPKQQHSTALGNQNKATTTSVIKQIHLLTWTKKNEAGKSNMDSKANNAVCFHFTYHGHTVFEQKNILMEYFPK